MDPQFPFGLFNLDWETFGQNLEGHLHRCPAVEDAGIKSTVCGPESFTLDHKPSVGPQPGVRGMFNACGFNSMGMILGGAIGDHGLLEVPRLVFHGLLEVPPHYCQGEGVYTSRAMVLSVPDGLCLQDRMCIHRNRTTTSARTKSTKGGGCAPITRMSSSTRATGTTKLSRVS